MSGRNGHHQPATRVERGVVLVIVGLADGRPSPLVGQYVMAVDVDAWDGRGAMTTTTNLSRARTFESAEDAWEYWRRPSTLTPLRPDGRANRPATAYTVEVVPVTISLEDQP